MTVVIQGEAFPVHKVILSAASPYFKNQIQQILQNQSYSGCGSPMICIVTDKCTPRQFSLLLDYIYKGGCDVPEQVSRNICFINFHLKN